MAPTSIIYTGAILSVGADAVDFVILRTVSLVGDAGEASVPANRRGTDDPNRLTADMADRSAFLGVHRADERLPKLLCTCQVK